MNLVKTIMGVFSIDFCRLEPRKKHQVKKSGSIFFTLKETFTSLHNSIAIFHSFLKKKIERFLSSSRMGRMKWEHVKFSSQKYFRLKKFRHKFCLTLYRHRTWKLRESDCLFQLIYIFHSAYEFFSLIEWNSLMFVQKKENFQLIFARKCLLFFVHLLHSKLSKDIVCGLPNRVCSVKAFEKLLFSTINVSNFKNILWTSNWVFMYLLCRKTFFSQQLM